jgi:3',5'-cyclic AMP phosphodiesterase CpdA
VAREGYKLKNILYRVVLSGLFLVLAIGVAASSQVESPVIWGPVLGVIGETSIAISWNTLRAVGADLHYSAAEVYDATGIWEETLSFEPHEGVAEIQLRGLAPGSTYRYQVVIYEGDAVYPSPIGYFTTVSAEPRPFSFLIYGDTRTHHDRHKLVADTMARDEPEAVLVINTGDLVESPTIGRFKSFFAAIANLALSHPYLAVIGNHEKGHSRYYEFFALPSGGGKAGEEWWSFDYGNVHFVGINSCAATASDAVTRIREQMEWVREDLANSDAKFKVVLFHHPIYSSTWEGGVNESMRAMWESIFRETGVDLVLNGHMHCYEHFYIYGIHYVVTGGGGAPLQDPVDEVADGTVCRRYNTLHYLRITVAGDTLRVEAIPVASVYNDEVHLVPSGRPFDSFTIIRR